MKQARHFIPYRGWCFLEYRKGDVGLTYSAFLSKRTTSLCSNISLPLSDVVMNPNFTYRSRICTSTCMTVYNCSCHTHIHTGTYICTYVITMFSYDMQPLLPQTGSCISTQSSSSTHHTSLPVTQSGLLVCTYLAYLASLLLSPRFLWSRPIPSMWKLTLMWTRLKRLAIHM